MSRDIDLDITKYTVIELQNILGVHSDLNIENIYESYADKLKQIVETNSIMGDDKKDYIAFITSIKQQLLRLAKTKINSITNMEKAHPLVNHIKQYPSFHINSFNSGEINPVQRNICIVQLSFNSLYRPNYVKTNSNNFHLTLPNPLKNVISMRLGSLEIPNISYEISEENGTDRFTYTTNTGTTIDVILPVGNYSLFNFKTAFDLAATDLELNISNSEITGKLTINIKGGSSITSFSVYFNIDRSRNCGYTKRDSPQVTLGTMMGFLQSTYENATTLTSDTVISLAGVNYIYFSVNDYQKSMHEVVLGVFEQNYLANSILARINLASSKNMINFNDNADFMVKKRTYFGPVNIEKLRFQLLDSTGKLLNIQNANYSFALEFEILYKY